MPTISSNPSRRRRSEGGMMVLLMACLLLFIVPIIGLVVDCSLIYFVRSRLAAAADAAALATARSLNLGQTLAAQNTAAVARGLAFFDANFPSGVYSTRNTSISIPNPAYGTTQSTLQTIYVSAVGQTDAPTYFMNIFAIDHVTVKVNGQAARRNINLILVLDKSGSMNNGTTPSACDAMKTAATNFVTYFSNNRDTIGLVTFNTAYYDTFAPVSAFNPGITTAISGITCVHGTNTANALNRAYYYLQQINQPSALNVIVLFTDGQPTVLTCDFPLKKKQDYRYGDASNGTSPSYLYPSASSQSTNYTLPPSPCKDVSADQWYKSPTYTNPAGTLNPNWTPFLVGNPGAGATAGTIRGAISDSTGGSPAATGYTGGLFNWVNGYTNITTSGSCAFETLGNGPRRDVAYIPSTDIYGNSTSGFRTNWVYPTRGNFTGNDKFTTTNTETTYRNQIRPDSPQAVTNAAYNATDAQGSTIRADATLIPVIYTIGLGGNDSYGVDTELLIRLANVQTATAPDGTVITNTIYSTTQGQGLYAYAPNSTQLNQAFAMIASSVLRLSH